MRRARAGVAFIVFALSMLMVVANGCHAAIHGASLMTSVAPSGPNTLTYIGHATVLLRLDGFTALTDPLYSEHVGPYRRLVRPGIQIGDLPRLDVILISHGHWDHLDSRTLRQLDKAAVVVVPAGLETAVRNLGFREVRGLKPWETTTVQGAEITAVPAQHIGIRCGYLIRRGATLYFGGDTGLFEGMRAIGDRQPIDIALLPIGAYRPHLSFIPGLTRAMRRIHMSPDDVPAAARMLGAKLVVPIHWGTFKLTGEPIDEPLERLREIVTSQRLQALIRVLVHGETIAF